MNMHKFRSVRDAILCAIAADKWRPGAPMPNDKELAKEFDVSVKAMRETLEALEREHVLIRAKPRLRTASRQWHSLAGSSSPHDIPGMQRGNKSGGTLSTKAPTRLALSLC